MRKPAQVAQLTSLADALWRGRMQEKAEDYRRGQQEAGAALLQAAAVVLAPEQLQHLQYDAANGEFGLRLADTMVEWGQKHISLLDAQGRSSFLQQVCMLQRTVSFREPAGRVGRFHDQNMRS